MKNTSPSQVNTIKVRVTRRAHKELLRRAAVNQSSIAEEVEKALGTYEYQPDIFHSQIQVTEPEN
jgi:hypothetical protein